jgi:hypothetical protein
LLGNLKLCGEDIRSQVTRHDLGAWPFFHEPCGANFSS